jgi:molecular chaperone IbpA
MGPRFYDIDRFFDQIFNSGEFRELEQLFNEAVRGSKTRYTCPSFPPANVKLDEEKNLTFEFALAGYSRDNIDISFSGNHMYLNVSPSGQEEEKVSYLCRGIKEAEVKNTYFVPQDKYDTGKANAKFDNGLLVVFIPSKEKSPEKAHKISIE